MPDISDIKFDQQTGQALGYFAAVLTDESAKKLRGLAIHPNVYCHHLTIDYKPTKEIFNHLSKFFGKTIKLDIVAIASNHKGQVALVNGFLDNGNQPHITISCAENITPNYSNSLVKYANADPKLLQPFNLQVSGVVTFIPFEDLNEQ